MSYTLNEVMHVSHYNNKSDKNKSKLSKSLSFIHHRQLLAPYDEVYYDVECNHSSVKTKNNETKNLLVQRCSGAGIERISSSFSSPSFSSYKSSPAKSQQQQMQQQYFPKNERKQKSPCMFPQFALFCNRYRFVVQRNLPSITWYTNWKNSFLWVLTVLWQSVTKSPTTKKSYSLITYILVITLLSIAIVAITIFQGFIKETKLLCRPPEMQPYGIYDNKPLIEYYIHGRGNGHYSRSIAIIEKLNEKGIDVRMFVGRSVLWRKKHSLHQSMTEMDVLDEVQRVWIENGLLENRTYYQPPHTNDGGQQKLSTAATTSSIESYGTNTAIPVSSLSPHLSLTSVVSTIIERIMGDCEVASQTQRYPLLVVSDGDLPGMLRAKIGSIPSVSISHGTTFSIMSPPSWLSPENQKAWRDQARLNHRSGYFSNWQIGVNFGAIREEQLDKATSTSTTTQNRMLRESAVVVPPRMRKEIRDMKKIRLRRSRRRHDHDNQPKFILCYFRDKNGDFIIQYLLQRGFHVISFHDDLKNSTHVEDNLRKNTSTKYQTDIQYDPIINAAKRTGKLIHITNPSLFTPYMSLVDGIVASAGSQLLSECMYAQIPLFALYKEDDSEQKLNVEMSRSVVTTSASTEQKKTVGFSTSFESFNEALLHHNENAMKDDAMQELESFLDIVQNSTTSQQYFIELVQDPSLLPSGNEDRREEEQEEEEEEEMWFDTMPDASAVIIEILEKIVDAT